VWATSLIIFAERRAWAGCARFQGGVNLPAAVEGWDAKQGRLGVKRKLVSENNVLEAPTRGRVRPPRAARTAKGIEPDHLRTGKGGLNETRGNSSRLLERERKLHHDHLHPHVKERERPSFISILKVAYGEGNQLRGG